MIIWGGRSNSTYYNTGARYNPASNTWAAMTNTGAPTARAEHTAVWTGSEMLIWGGHNASTEYNTGARYNPVSNKWTTIATTTAPARENHTAVWGNGYEMIIWGGRNGTTYYGDYNGTVYNSIANVWGGLYNSGPGARASHTAVWSALGMMIWGGRSNSVYLNDGARTSGGSAWFTLTSVGAPSPRENHTAVWSDVGDWTNHKMIVWGGNNGNSVLGDGGRYSLYNSWAGISTVGAPAARSIHTAVWTGYEMIVWGGTNVSSYLGDGGRYDPETDVWNSFATNLAPSPRERHTAVWTDQHQMIVWGGTTNSSFNALGTGARFIGEPPAITNSPQLAILTPLDCPASSAAPVGGAATLTGGATGILPLGYQWRHDGADIPNATNTSLVLSNLQPTSAGGYALFVTNWYGSVTSSAVVLNVNTQLIISPTTLPDGTAGATYRRTNTACGGFAPYIFSVLSGALPPGLSLSTSGILSGTPTNTGTFNFTVQATNSYSVTGASNYTITILCPGISFGPGSLPDGSSGSFYVQSFTACCGKVGPYSFTVSSGTLPPGLTLYGYSSELSGTPTASNYTSYNFTIRATDRYGCSATRDYSLSICPAIAVSPPAMPPGTDGAAYVQTLTASGGVPPHQFSISGGSLPAGVTLTTNGFLSTTSAPCGQFYFTVKATDAINCAGYNNYTLVFSSPNCPKWFNTTSLPDGLSDHSMAYWNGFLYVAGGASLINGVDDGTNVFYSQVHSNGTIGPWQKTSPLPETVFDHAGVAANGFVYVLGGLHYSLSNDYTQPPTVYYASINSNGSLASWQTANDLPKPLARLSASVWNSTIYVIGGDNQQPPSSNVYSAKIQADGSLSAWTEQTPLPVDGIYTHASVANGALYVLGGFINSGTTIQNKVYYSKINADGTLAGWNQTTPMLQPLSSFSAVAAGGRIFVMCGSDNTQILNVFYVASVMGDGSLSAWSVGPPLPQVAYLLAATVTDSYIFVSGGANITRSLDAVYSMPLPLPPAAPALTSQGMGTNGNFQLKLASATNTGFGFLASTNLTDWTRLGWGFTGTNGLLSFEDTNAASFPHRFYRAYWPLP